MSTWTHITGVAQYIGHEENCWNAGAKQPYGSEGGLEILVTREAGSLHNTAIIKGALRDYDITTDKGLHQDIHDYITGVFAGTEISACMYEVSCYSPGATGNGVRTFTQYVRPANNWRTERGSYDDLWDLEKLPDAEYHE